MNTSELQCCIDGDYTLKGHVNVYAADYLLDLIGPLPCGIIVNADVHYKPGTHWCAIFFDEKRNNYIFDSFGYPPEHYGLFYCFIRSSIVLLEVFLNKIIEEA